MTKLVSIEPESNLTFFRNPNENQTRLITIRNLTDTYVNYKIKTTKPDSFFVRSSSGIIASNQSVMVAIILQGKSLAWTSTENRFLVQALKSTNSEPLSKTQWQTVDVNECDCHRLSVAFTNNENAVTPTAKRNSLDPALKKTHELENTRNVLHQEVMREKKLRLHTQPTVSFMHAVAFSVAIMVFSYFQNQIFEVLPLIR